MTDKALDPAQLREGMVVFSTDGERIGEIQRVGDEAILIARGNYPSIHVPFAFVRYAAGNNLVLTIPANKVGEMNWETSAH